MVHIFSFNEFVNESRGQRISLRATNRPFDPNDNQWTQARDSRKERALELSLNRKTNDIHKLIDRFYDAAKKIFMYNDKIRGVQLFSEVSPYFVAYDGEEVAWDTDYLFHIIPSDNGKLECLFEDDEDGIDKRIFVSSSNDIKKEISVDVHDYDGIVYDCLKVTGKFWWGYSEYDGEPLTYSVIIKETEPVFGIKLCSQVPNGLNKFIEHNGFSFGFLDKSLVFVDLKDLDKFMNVLDKYISKY